VEHVAAFETATLHESGAKSVMSPKIRMLSGDRRIAGPAFTVMCHPGDNLMIHVGLTRAKPGDVFVVQCNDPNYGVWGEVLSVAAMARGIVALILDGSVRDLAAIRKLAFPVFARGTCLRGTVKASAGIVDQPISCGGQPVFPGDLVVADESGIVVMPPGEVQEILAKSEERVRKEAVMMNELRSGRTTMQLLGLEGKFARD
jgi:4-hydroxy-4-methyl-2-oxoglutarate aldolase